MVTTRKRTYLPTKQLRRCRPRYASPDQIFNQDVWSSVGRFLYLKDLASLVLTAKFFVSLFQDELVWKALCLRKLGFADAPRTERTFSWKDLFRSASADQSVCNHARNNMKCREWTRVGAFRMQSDKALALGRLWRPAYSPRCFHIISNVKCGIWVADLLMETCPKCDKESCEGSVQVMEFSHLELSLNDEYKSRGWNHKQLKVHTLKGCDAASCGVFDYCHLRHPSNSDIFNFKSWIGSKDRLHPIGTTSEFGAAGSSNLDKNRDVLVKFFVMTAGKEGPIVSIRISQELP